MNTTTTTAIVAPAPATESPTLEPMIIKNKPTAMEYTIPHWKQLPDETVEYLVRYGARESIQDSFSSATRDKYGVAGPDGDAACRDARRELANERVADLIAGNPPGARTRTRAAKPVLSVPNAVALIATASPEALAAAGLTPDQIKAVMLAMGKPALPPIESVTLTVVPVVNESVTVTAVEAVAEIVPPVVVADVKRRNKGTRGK